MSSSSLSDLLLFLLVTLAAEILGTIGGFGSSLFFVSIAQLLFDFQTVLALTGLLHIFSNTSKIILFRKTIHWKLVVAMGIPSFLMAIAGAYVTTQVDLTVARLLLGGFLLLFSIFFYFSPGFALSPSKGNAIAGGGLAGFLAGFIGTGGAIRGLVLAAFNLEKNLFVGTSAAIDFGVDLSRTAIYLDHEYLDRERMYFIPILIVASFAGSFIGKKLIEKISQETFRKMLLILIFIMGLLLVSGRT